MSIKLKPLLITLLLPALLFNSKLRGQDRVITLNEAIKLGLQNSKVLKLSQSKIDAAVSQYNQTKDLNKPNASASLGFNQAEIPVNTLSLGKLNLALPPNNTAWLGTVSASEVIFNGNKFKYAQESTELLTQVSRLDADLNKDEIAYSIISAYYTLYKVTQSKKVVEQNLATIDGQIKQSQRFYEQGLVTKNDVLRFQLQRANVELNGIDLETNRKIVNYNLNILLGLPETTQLKVETIADATKPLNPVTNYLDTALANRTELKQWDLRGQVSDKNINSILANQKPTLAASATGYLINTKFNPIPQSGSAITPLVLGLNLSWNFATIWTNKNKVAQARIEREEVDINKSILVDNIKREVNQNYQSYDMAINKINLLQTSIAQAGENNKILESKYKSNIASATDRADAQSLLYQAEINLELAKADAGLAYYTLLKSTGKLNK